MTLFATSEALIEEVEAPEVRAGALRVFDADGTPLDLLVEGRTVVLGGPLEHTEESDAALLAGLRDHLEVLRERGKIDLDPSTLDRDGALAAIMERDGVTQ
ncbi:MAG: hypothetical protein ABW167_04195 [Baekduia sp.]